MEVVWMAHSKQGTHWPMHTTLHCEPRRRMQVCVCDDECHKVRKVNQWRALRVATMASNAGVWMAEKETRVKNRTRKRKVRT